MMAFVVMLTMIMMMTMVYLQPLDGRYYCPVWSSSTMIRMVLLLSALLLMYEKRNEIFKRERERVLFSWVRLVMDKEFI